MKSLRNILITLGSLVGLFIVIGLFLPNTWEVNKSVVISASKEEIYPHLANLQKWLEWSPWNDKKDMSLKYSYEGPEEGVGAQQNWLSDKMGAGYLKITEAEPENGIKYDLFIDMGFFKSTLHGEMALKTLGEQSELIWTDRGENDNNIIRKWLALSTGSMLGKDMQDGLNKLKVILEQGLLKKEEAGAEN